MSPVPSPCVKVCALDEARRVCRGCGRTLDEIARWPTASEPERRAIIARASRRRLPA